DDDVRRVICPDKVTTDQWLRVHDTAHRLGLSSNNTIMFGHVDGPVSWARHLLRVREQQHASGGFTEFIPLPFVHMEAPMYLKGLARRGPTFGEFLLMHAVGRLALHPWITNVQVSWVKAGPDGVAAALRAGVNDLGGTLMNESISRAAGAAFGQEMPPERMEEMIRAAGRVPRQRTTLYGEPDPERVATSFGAAPLAEPLNPPVDTSGLRRPEILVRPGFAAA
ncbi:MAG: 7,8-didemethyl-8-hydroxy-5-deazariboflavin synthase, partial [Gaiellaceae bacterium]